MNIRDRLLRKSKKSNDNSYRDLYREFRNRASTELRESKASYFYSYFQKNSNNMKKLWSGIKSVISIRRTSSLNTISKIKDSNGEITSDQSAIANIFNKYFTNIAHDNAKKIPRSNKSLVDLMGDKITNPLFIAPIVLTEISDIISRSKFGKSLGPKVFQ